MGCNPIVTADSLQLFSTIAALLAAFASWRAVSHATRSWKYERASGAYSRLVRDPMLVAVDKYKQGLGSLVARSHELSENMFAGELRQLSHGYLVAVHPLRAVRTFDLTALVLRLETLIERCEDDLSNLFARRWPLGSDASPKMEEILQDHSTALKDLLEHCDPGRRRDFPKLPPPPPLEPLRQSDTEQQDH